MGKGRQVVPAKHIHEGGALGLGHLEHHTELLGKECPKRELIALDCHLLRPNFVVAPVCSNWIDGEQVQVQGDPTPARERHFTETSPEAAIGAIVVGQDSIALTQGNDGFSKGFEITRVIDIRCVCIRLLKYLGHNTSSHPILITS
ncbi:MAG: hypothetical protein EBR88_06940 [Betaproteobacteria bacterium]|nr:hypothetical protein [Betaproteobacteria bacterium]